MRQLLVTLSEYCITAIDAIALLVIVIGTVETLIKGVPMMFSSPTAHQRRDVTP